MSKERGADRMAVLFFSIQISPVSNEEKEKIIDFLNSISASGEIFHHQYLFITKAQEYNEGPSNVIAASPIFEPEVIPEPELLIHPKYRSVTGLILSRRADIMEKWSERKKSERGA